jgi:hypothetical protein
LAAEAVGRRCRAVELDGPYCDVIIRRWREMTGGEVILEATGETFDEVQALRGAEDVGDPRQREAKGADRDLDGQDHGGCDERE